MPPATARRATSSSLDALTWLKLDWDEGVGVGGPHEPYRQSQRSAIYLDVIERLKASGHVYESFSNAEEIDARNEAAGRPKQLGYDNFDRDLTDEQRAAFRAEGREPALRLRVPDADLSFTDLVRGEITFPAGSFVDFVVVRPNGAPLYTLVNPVDDAHHADHARAARRGPALLDSAPDRALPRAHRHRAHHVRAAVRPPALRHGRRQQEALEARPRVEPVPPPRPRLHPRGPGQLPVAARLVALARPRRLHRGRDGRRVRRRRREPEPGALRPEEGRVDQRRPHPPARRAATSPRAPCPTSRPPAS